MEENVALDSSKQKKFVKSIKGIKKLIQKNEQKAAVVKPLVNLKSKEDLVQEGKKIKKRKFPRGLVYLSHIPHGFYEHQMTQYFKQFGVVTNARVIRSKRTGRSKGFAFVEFKEPSVAEIVAETMNNYLMGKRLIKAAYIPPEKQRRKAMRKHWNDINNPANNLRMEMKKKFNTDKDEQGELKKARKLLSNLNKTKKKLKEIGINYDFFMPVDIPEAILETMIKIEKVEENSQEDEDQKITTKKNKKIKAENSKEETKKLNSDVVKESKLRNIEANKKENSKVNDTKNKKVEEKQKKGKNKEQKSKLVLDDNKQQQKNKESKLNDSGIKPMGDFVKVGQYSDDDDSSLEFDSDEYEKMMGSDDEFDSDDHSDDSEGDEDVDDESQKEEESFAILPPAKNNLLQNKKQNKKMKRKAAQNQVSSLKKPKFEKQKSQKQVKKPIKVKK
ncbi:hypothetical protein K1T71_005462 [Dendrolimus kikuchii]|uniref:Uncharacterized protein n=1 Tax=Dendrolimus kikuchii TaxID=765133 RepID=A0ACC1D5J5_9NEOP|nr:hypothetical protein K1T71_005462 [Dendrolimus kikuchii]